MRKAILTKGNAGSQPVSHSAVSSLTFMRLCDLCAVFVSFVVKKKHDFNGESVSGKKLIFLSNIFLISRSTGVRTYPIAFLSELWNKLIRRV